MFHSMYRWPSTVLPRLGFEDTRTCFSSSKDKDIGAASGQERHGSFSSDLSKNFNIRQRKPTAVQSQLKNLPRPSQRRENQRMNDDGSQQHTLENRKSWLGRCHVKTDVECAAGEIVKAKQKLKPRREKSSKQNGC